MTQFLFGFSQKKNLPVKHVLKKKIRVHRCLSVVLYVPESHAARPAPSFFVES